jgi:hypothetical protein
MNLEKQRDGAEQIMRERAGEGRKTEHGVLIERYAT